jgi:hypothetical protein
MHILDSSLLDHIAIVVNELYPGYVAAQSCVMYLNIREVWPSTLTVCWDTSIMMFEMIRQLYPTLLQGVLLIRISAGVSRLGFAGFLSIHVFTAVLSACLGCGCTRACSVDVW